jgi:hypothetical protein
MTEASAPTSALEKRNLAYHAILGVAMGLVAVVTLWAWIPATLTGMVIGHASVEQSKGIRAGRRAQVAQVLAVTGGVLAMMLLGLVFGGMISFLVAALAAFSERLAGNTPPSGQAIARILVLIVTAVTWFIAVVVLNLSISVNIGG